MDNDSLQDNRLRGFVRFFKGYIGIMPLVTAAIAPLLTMMKAIPVFESQKSTLATYSGLLGFLLLAWVFYVRGPFVRMMVPKAEIPQSVRISQSFYFTRILSRFMQRALANFLPLFLIFLSLFCFVNYTSTLDEAIAKAKPSNGLYYSDIVSRHDVLEKWGQREPIFEGIALEYYYLGIFLSAELAFVVMALREYAYAVLKVPEVSILGGRELEPPA